MGNVGGIGPHLRHQGREDRGGLTATGADLATIAPDSIESVFKHYALVGKARAGIRALARPPGAAADDRVRVQWIQVCDEASVGVTNSATEALRSLGLPLET